MTTSNVCWYFQEPDNSNEAKSDEIPGIRAGDYHLDKQ